MPLNKTKISWPDATSNLMPFCSRGCAYCYRQRIMNLQSCQKCRRNQPHFHEERLADLTAPHPRAPLKVFVNSMGETFDPKCRPEWYRPFWEAIEQSPHQIIIATKNPHLIGPKTFPWAVGGRPHDWPEHLWLLVSAESQRQLDVRLGELAKRVKPGRLGLSLEPALGPFPKLESWLSLVEWIIFGGLSGSWLPPGWKVKRSLAAAQARWAVEVAKQIASPGQWGMGVPLFVKPDTPLPDPAPRDMDYPPAMQALSPTLKQAALF